MRSIKNMTLILSALIFSCSLATQSYATQSSKVYPVVVGASGVSALCDRVSEIKVLPHRGERGVDAAYDALMEAGESVVACLIEKITDTRIMPDPRCPVFSRETKVGDVAYFVLLDITNIGFVEMLPAKVQEKYKTEGTYAYHKYIERKGKRRQLQARLWDWYRRKYSKEL